VAGQVRILKEGEVLFRSGDQADSMFIVRHGVLKVYFLKGNDEVQLATLTDGAIVGEMAFFDQKPRSAYVKALTQTEITEITRADFDRLLTQIPRWLVTMMQSLSGRLRTTNDKLAALEKGQLSASFDMVSDLPLIPIVRTLRILQLLIQQLAQKEGVNQSLDYQTTLEWWLSLTGWSRDYFAHFIAVMEKLGVLSKKSDDNKSQRIVLTSRVRLSLFSDFVIGLQTRASFDSLRSFGPAWIALFEAVLSEASASGYETYNVPVTAIPANYAGLPSDRQERLKIADDLAHWLLLKSTKTNVEILLKVSPKEHKNTVTLLKMLNTVLSEKLDSIV
jgi:CRP-like cAMP-binding protein